MFHTPRFARTAGAAGPSGPPGSTGTPSYTHIIRSTNQSVANGGDDTISWSSEVSDIPGGWSSGTPTKIIVPSGITLARITSSIRWASNSANNRAITITLNGSDLQQVAYKAFSTSDMPAITPWIAVTAGDEFTMRGYQDSGGPLNITSGTWMQAEWY